MSTKGVGMIREHSGVVIEGVGILWAEMDSSRIVVVVRMLLVWGKQAGKCWCCFHSDGNVREKNRPHRRIPQC